LNETERIAVANWVPKFGAFRLTLTPPVINRSRKVLFIATGSEKAAALSTVVEGEYKPADTPAQMIRPQAGGPDWLVDEAAAAALRRI
jgi:6-phosphogluconolactonase